LRAAVLAAGTRVLAQLLEPIGSGRRDEPLYCCGEKMQSTGLAPKPLLTILGRTPYARSRFVCEVCGAVRYPGDEELDVIGTTRSPGVRRMMARAGSRTTFKEGRDDLKIYAGLTVSAKDVERTAEKIGAEMEVWQAREREELLQLEEPLRIEKDIPVLYVSCDGTGAPMVPSELVGRKGKQKDGSSKTREVKLGAVFTQTATNEEGYAVRDPDSTSFVGAIETAEEHGWRLYAEAVRRGLWRAEQVVVLGDGAAWIKNIAETHFPGAQQIVDLYHTREHVAKLAKLLSGSEEKQYQRRKLQWWTWLDENKAEKIIDQAKKLLPPLGEIRKKVEEEITYLVNNKERMRYADYRAQGWFVGSGVIEAGCRTLIGSRLKQSGMEWTVRGANAIIALRCVHSSGRLEDYWESRTDPIAAHP
jgi:hypothetical protein